MSGVTHVFFASQFTDPIFRQVKLVMLNFFLAIVISGRMNVEHVCDLRTRSGSSWRRLASWLPPGLPPTPAGYIKAKSGSIGLPPFIAAK